MQIPDHLGGGCLAVALLVAEDRPRADSGQSGKFGSAEPTLAAPRSDLRSDDLVHPRGVHLGQFRPNWTHQQQYVMLWSELPGDEATSGPLESP